MLEQGGGGNAITLHTSVFRSLKGKPTKSVFDLRKFRYETLEISKRYFTPKKDQLRVLGFDARLVKREIGKKKRTLDSFSRDVILWKRRGHRESYDRFLREDSDAMASESPSNRIKDDTTRFGKYVLIRPT